MFHSSSCCLLATFLASVVVVEAAPSPKSIWSIDIWEGPAPPPDKGPPISAHASRNKSLLPAQIGGIVGAYVITALFWLTLLFVVGRRIRRKAQASNRTLKMEVVKPLPGRDYELADLKNMDTPMTVSTVATNTQWPSPIKENASPRSPNLTWTSPSGHRKTLSAQESVVTIDESVVEGDRARGQREMERLYAAVMEHDAKQAKTIYDAKRDGASPPKSPRSPREYPRSPRSPRSPREYPEFQHLRPQNAIGPAPMSPMGPTPIPQPMSPMGPTPIEPPNSPARANSRSSKLSKPSPLSFFTPAHSRGSSAQSNASSRFRRSIRGLPISPPMGSPDLATSFQQRTEEEPLSPRLYNPGPPPMPPSEKQVAFARTPIEIRSPPSGRAPAPSPLPLGSATSSKSSLAFRSPTFQRQYNTPQSAPPTKTTILDRRESQLRQPKTGVPATPYSPYTPFSVTTPITPGFLVGKRERKEMNKGLRVVDEEDLVKNDSDMWGA